MPLHFYKPPDSDPVPAPAAPPDEDKAASAKTTGIVALAIMCSRVLGLIRDMLFAALFPEKIRDCFIAAFRFPNMLRDLFAEGALSTAFVTVFAQKLKLEGEKSAWVLAHRMLSLAVVFMSGISLLGVLVAPVLMPVLLYGWTDAPEWKLDFTVLLTQIMYPFILLVSLAALVMGILNSRKIFGIPAMASSFFNIGSIVGGWLLGCLLEGRFTLSEMGWKGMIGFSIGTLTGGLAQLGVQLPALFRTGCGFRFTRDWKHPDVKRILQLMWPAVVAGSAVQVSVFLNTFFATSLPEKDGPVSWLNNSFRLMQLPLGVFGVAVATVTLPIIARAATDGVTPAFRGALARGNRLVAFLTLPSAIGLFILAHPIISVLYERGQFDGVETAQTAGALRWYAVGLIFYAQIKVIQPAFTAINQRMLPMYVSLAAMVLNVGLNSLFVFVLHKDHTWLALTTAVMALFNWGTLYWLLARKSGGLQTQTLVDTIRRLLPGVLALAAVSFTAWHWIMEPRWQHSGFVARASMLGLVIAAAGTAYMILAHICRVDEAKQFMDIAGRKLRR
jgi:putative peptidoglycan lipid II flippase